MLKSITISILTILLYSPSFSNTIKLTNNNIVYIKGTINSESMKQAKQDLVDQDIKRDIKDYPIYIVINSSGGDIFEGNDFIRFAQSINNLKTICIFCASMAHAISQAIEGERLGVEDNIMMAHRAAGGIQGQYEDGELESKLIMMKSVFRRIESRNAKRIGISLKDYKQKVINEWWTHAEESIEQNVLDRLVKIKCDKELINKKRIRKIKTIFGSTNSDPESQCPLL